MSRAPAWSSDEQDLLLRLRDVENASWDAIAEAMPSRSAGALKLRYYSVLYRRNGVAHKPRKPGRPRKAPPRVIPPAPPPVVPPQAPAPVVPPVVPAPAPGPRVEVRRRQSQAVLQADAELRARIAELGLTGGLLGDPAPGRSALDKRGGGNG